MAKTYYITESQYKTLLESKQLEKKNLIAISEEIDLKRKTLTEAKALNEGVIDTVKKYLRAGALTAGILGSLLAAQKVDAQQLQQAGVPTELVQQAVQQSAKHNPGEMSNKQIEQRLVQIMRQNNLGGSLKSFNALGQQQKDNIINGIKTQIKSLDDINKISIGNWTDKMQQGQNVVQFDQTSRQEIRVVTIDTVSSVPMQQHFAMNSIKLSSPQETKATLDSLVSYFTEIDSITIESSSSTLRNKGEAEGMTWQQLSQARGEAIQQLLVGDNIDLGGEGVNVVGKITTDMITINSAGQNGDGTSGPKSPYEVGEFAQNYTQRGIDPKFWQSASQEEALPETQLSQYGQYQYVVVKIYGRVVETDTQDVPSYRYIVLQVSKAGGKVETGSKKKVQDVSKCPVKVKKQDIKNAPLYK
jgi:hypothetical protein